MTDSYERAFRRLSALEPLSDRDLQDVIQDPGRDRREDGLVARFEIADRQSAERAACATQLAERLMNMATEAALRRAAAFTLRCDDGCTLAMIFGRRVNHPDSPPNNELLICWTRKQWRATLYRWYWRNHDALDRDRALPVACRHGSGLFYIAAMGDLVCHSSPEATKPDTLFPFGATRRLSDPMTGLTGGLASWRTPSGTVGELLTDPGVTLGMFALGESVRARR